MISNDNLRRAEELYSRACDKKALGEFDSAIRLFKEALSLNPDYVEALNNLGNVYSGQGEYKKGLIYFKRALELNSEEPILLNNAGICYMECKNFDTALECYTKAINNNPQFYPAYSNCGKLFLLRGDPKSAKKYFEQALEINPSYVEARVKLDSVNQLLEMSDTGGKEETNWLNKEYFEKKNDPTFDGLLHKARVYFANGQFGDSAHNFQKALELQPNSIESLVGLSSLYLALGEYYKTNEFTDKALALDSNNKESHFNKGSANYYLKNLSEAISALRKFLFLADSERDESDGNYLIGICFFEKGDIKNSILHLEKIKDYDNPNNGEVFFALANSYFADGDNSAGNQYMLKAAQASHEGAIKWRQEKQVNDSQLSDELSESGFDKFRSNNYLEALKDLNKAIQINDQNHLAYYRRALVHLNREDISFAIDDFDKAIEIQPSDKEYFFGRGNAKMQIGNRVEAKRDFEKALELGHSEAKLILKTSFKDETNEIYKLVGSAITSYSDKDFKTSRDCLRRIFNHFTQNPGELNKFDPPDILSTAFFLMTKVGITNDIDNKQIIASLGYLVTSIAIKELPSEKLILLRNRLMIMRKESEALGYSVITANNIGGKFIDVMVSGRDPHFESRNILWAMEIHDLNIEPSLKSRYELFNKWSQEHDMNISHGVFHPQSSRDSVKELGAKYHSILYNYLSEKVINRGDLDFDKQ